MKQRLLIILTSLLISSSLFAAPNIFGYFDMEKNWASGRGPVYDQHHLNIMLEHEVSRFQFFSELEYEHGTNTEDGKGKIVVERAWAKIHLSNLFVIHTGILLNTTYYQQNHFPSLTNFNAKPWIHGRVFNESIEGMAILGSTSNGFNYNFWHERSQDKTGRALGGANYGTRLGYYYNSNDLEITTGFHYAKYLKEDTASANQGVNYHVTSSGFEMIINYKSYSLWYERGLRKDDKLADSDIEGNFLFLTKTIETKHGDFFPTLRYEDINEQSNQASKRERYGFSLTYRPEPEISIKAEIIEEQPYQNNNNITQPKAHQGSLAFVYFYK